MSAAELAGGDGGGRQRLTGVLADEIGLSRSVAEFAGGDARVWTGLGHVEASTMAARLEKLPGKMRWWLRARRRRAPGLERAAVFVVREKIMKGFGFWFDYD